MARAKIKRGSTSVDMTPMCDVAFLLLTFFILAAKFKPPDAIQVSPPSSVSNKVAPQKDYINVTISKDNKVFLDMDPGIKDDVLDELGAETNMTFSAQDKANFKDAGFIGVPLNQFKQFIALTPDEVKARAMQLPGIPVDSTNNQLATWISAAQAARLGQTLNYLIKGDDAVKYPTFKAVIDAFKKNDIYKYNLVTNSKAVPEGSELYKKNMMGESKK
jgi:biopolymer transport protein ExbD